MLDKLSDQDFQLFKKYIYNKVGIDLGMHKHDLLRNRLKKRALALNISTFEDYYEYLIAHNDELSFFISAITTNITSFFRESGHWTYLNEILPDYMASKSDKMLRIWSAGCATGEEPYTIAIFLHELIAAKKLDMKIVLLATDISPRALAKARSGKYSEKELDGLSVSQKSFFFDKVDDDFIFKHEFKKSIEFGSFNLVYGDFEALNIAGAHQFDIIFCRNVMIYFDNDVRSVLVDKYISKLLPSGYLFVGHSESLMAYNLKLEGLERGIYRNRKK